MPKFVLIDHSITDLGGHHYEYAVRVLKAAADAGYETVLATNRGFRPHRACLDGEEDGASRQAGWGVLPAFVRHLLARHLLHRSAQGGWGPKAQHQSSCFGLVSRGTSQHASGAPSSNLSAWRVVPVYRYGFWYSTNPSWLLAPARYVVCRVAHHAVRWKYRWYFSQWGIFWSQRHRGREILRHGLSPRHLLLAGLFVATVLYPLRVAKAVAELLAALVPIGRYVRRVARAAHQVLLAIGWPLKVIAARRKKVADMAFAWRKRLAFGADTLRLLRKVKLAEGDVVFIPTLAEPEMLGLLKVFERHPAASRASWHLLFRRNIFVGREPDYPAQDEGLRPLRNAFQQFRQRTAGRNISFYTDTEPLTIQYNRLGVANFVTAPIPVAEGFRVQDSGFSEGSEVRGQRSGFPALSRSPESSRALAPSRPRALAPPHHIVYIGDARTEKGYHLLPHLVANLEADGPSVRFTFQSNYNIPGGEPAAAVARAQLDCFPTDRVLLLDEPLASDEYRELLLSADVVVVPYDRDNYYARSSGIFAEALAAGKPVVVPGGSWMATELSSVLCDYHFWLRQLGASIDPHQPEASARSGGTIDPHQPEASARSGDQAASLTLRVGEESASQRPRIVESIDPSRLVWKTRDDGKSRVVQPNPLPICGQTPTTCRLDVPPEATHLLVTFRLANHQRGLFTGIAAEQFADNLAPHPSPLASRPAPGVPRPSSLAPRPYLLDRTAAIVGGGADPRGSLLVSLAEGAAQIKLSLRNPISALPLALDDLRIDFLSAPCGLAAGAVGAVYAEPGDLARHLREVLAHFEHYQATATELSHRWAGYHSPKDLVEHLISPNHARCHRQHRGAPKLPPRSSNTVTRRRRRAERRTCNSLLKR